GRPDGSRRPGDAGTALHGVAAEWRDEWRHRFDGLAGGSVRGLGPRDQAGRSNRSRTGRGGAGDYLEAIGRFVTSPMSGRAGSHEVASHFYIPLPEWPSRAAKEFHAEETGR